MKVFWGVVIILGLIIMVGSLSYESNHNFQLGDKVFIKRGFWRNHTGVISDKCWAQYMILRDDGIYEFYSVYNLGWEKHD